MRAPEDGREAAPEARTGRLVLLAMLPLFIALPLGYVASALLVHGAFIARGLEPWKMEPSSLLAAFGPLEISLAGLGNQLAFLAFLLPALRHRSRRAALFGASATASQTAGPLLLAAVAMYSLSSLLSVVVSTLGLDGEGTLAQLNDVIGRLSLSERLALLPVLALSAGVFEELFFRGFLFRRLEVACPPVAVITLTALAFGLAHLDPVHSTAAFVMGLYLGWLRHRSGSVWPGIAAHVFSNGAVVLTHRWLDDLSDIPLTGALATLLVFALAAWALDRRLSGSVSAEYRPRPTSSADPG